MGNHPRLLQRLISMRRFAFFILLSSMCGLVVVSAGVGPAYACDYDAPIGLSIDVLGAADDLEHLNAIEGPFRAAYNDRLEQNEREPLGDDELLPRFVSFERRRTVAHAEAPGDTYASPAAVGVREGVWGATGNFDEPVTYAFDTSSCAGDFQPPELGESEWLVTIDRTNAASISWVTFWTSEDQVAQAEEHLTRIFGEPLRPETEVAAIQDAMAALVRAGERSFDEPVKDIQYADGFAPALGEEADDSDGPNLLALLPTMALTAVAVLGAGAIVVKVVQRR